MLPTSTTNANVDETESEAEVKHSRAVTRGIIVASRIAVALSSLSLSLRSPSRRDLPTRYLIFPFSHLSFFLPSPSSPRASRRTPTGHANHHEYEMRHLDTSGSRGVAAIRPSHQFLRAHALVRYVCTRHPDADNRYGNHVHIAGPRRNRVAPIYARVSAASHSRRAARVNSDEKSRRGIRGTSRFKRPFRYPHVSIPRDSIRHRIIRRGVDNEHP